MNRIFLLFFLFYFPHLLYAQADKKLVSAISVSKPPKIDGILDEEAWLTAPLANDFVQRFPYNGRPATFLTEVRFLYDNSGLYVGAMMYDPSPDSIPMQLGLRDATGLNTDNFILVLSPFNDGLNSFCFLVYSSDVQADFKLNEGGQNNDDDFSWDAVWQSKARKNKKGWVVEMKIPYSAIRFPKKNLQEWGMNCQRDIRRYRETVTWNLVDSKVQGYTNQCGRLQGISNIKPPLRLSLTPYLSGYLEKNPGEPAWQLSYNYGADLKYGINESYTLDMTLIPDFGQVPSDDKIYNFSPFEIRYDEKRQFFTEGTELFNKGGIFYSRRVGNLPRGYDEVYFSLDTNEKVTENPMQTKLINATKVSGRTAGGMGIGVFNGMSANTWAQVTDTLTGASRRVMTQGFTNYNMLVFDQNLKNNSYFDVLNTNYYMPTEGYTANVSGIDFKFANKKLTYALWGNGFVSQKYYSHHAPDFGYHYSLDFGKTSGNFQFDLTQVLETPGYDPNDMGFNLVNNRFNNKINLRYNIYEPFGNFLNSYNSFSISYNCLYEGLKFTSFEFHGASNATTKKHLTFGINTDFSPVPFHDYYESRVPGWMYISPPYGNLTAWISSDYRKKFAIDLSLAGYILPANKSTAFGVGIEPRYRISNRLFLVCSLNYEKVLNDVGYVMDSLDLSYNPVIIFGRRDRQTVVNVLQANFMFNSKMSLDLRARHYWVSAPYYAFSRLKPDGSLTPVNYNVDQDVNFNLFNIDLTYIWNFAPGSQLSLMWKNAISTFNNDIAGSFFEDFAKTISAPASNSFSIRILYYLDALYFQKKKKQ